MDDEVRYVVGAAGEVSRLVDAYRLAVRGAEQLRSGLIAAGLDAEGLTVTAGVSESGRPLVHVTVLPVVAVQLATLIAEDSGPSPGPLPRGQRDGPDVA